MRRLSKRGVRPGREKVSNVKSSDRRRVSQAGNQASEPTYIERDRRSFSRFGAAFQQSYRPS